MSVAWGSRLHFEPGSWLEVAHDTFTGLWSGATRSFVIMGTWVYVNIVRPLANLVGVHHLPEGKREYVKDGKLKVAVVGFGRTGTVSKQPRRRCGIFLRSTRIISKNYLPAGLNSSGGRMFAFPAYSTRFCWH